MSKDIHTPREELICGAIDRAEDIARDHGLVYLMDELARIRNHAERMEAKLVSRKQEAERYELYVQALKSELAALKAGQGEVVAIAECREVHGHMCQFLNRTQHGMDTLRDGDKLYTAPPVSVPAAMPERWEDRLSRMHQTIQVGCWPKRWVDDAKDYELGELRALIARQEAKL